MNWRLGTVDLVVALGGAWASGFCIGQGWWRFGLLTPFVVIALIAMVRWMENQQNGLK